MIFADNNTTQSRIQPKALSPVDQSNKTRKTSSPIVASLERIGASVLFISWLTILAVFGDVPW